MRDYTLSEYQLISEYTAKYRKDIDNVKMECRHHLRNEVSALILERKFHDIEMRFRKERRNTMTKTVEVKKAYFIENHPNHPDLAKVLDIYDTEIIAAQNFVFESFEDFVVRIPDITQWSCYYSMYFDESKFERTVLTY
jgi:hypothetical protein